MFDRNEMKNEDFKKGVYKLSESTFWVGSRSADTNLPHLLTTNIYKNRYFVSLEGKDSLVDAAKADVGDGDRKVDKNGRNHKKHKATKILESKETPWVSVFDMTRF